MILQLLIIFLGAIVPPVSSSYECLCNYSTVKSVFKSPSTSSAVLGVLDEYDCKPVYTIAQVDPAFCAIQLNGQVGYFVKDDSSQVQLCAGYPQPLDLVLTTVETITTTPRTTIATITTTKTTTETTSPSTTEVTPPPKTTPQTTSTTTSPPTSAPFTGCPGDWEEHGPSCYLFMLDDSQATSWGNAKDFCEGRGSHLVFIESQEEQQFIFNQIHLHSSGSGATNSFSWIGASGLSPNGTWQWSNVTNSIPMFGYQNWVDGHPRQNEVHTEQLGKCTGHKDKYHQEAALAFHMLSNQCDPGWVAQGDTCYLFQANKWLTWKDANDQCASENGHLLFIESPDEQNYITNYILHTLPHLDHNDHYNFWIGATDKTVEGQFVWYDGSTTTSHPLRYTNWRVGEPNSSGDGHNEDCVILRGPRHFDWNDFSCSTKVRYICEKPPRINVYITSTTLKPLTFQPTTSAVTSSSTSCPDDWIPFRNSCYKLNTEPMTWHHANMKCSPSHGHLAYVSTHADQEFLEKTLEQFMQTIGQPEPHFTGFWIGATDKGHEGQWMWKHGQIHRPVNSHLHLWAHSQPNGEGNCANMRRDFGFKWDDTNCSDHLAFICETTRQDEQEVVHKSVLPVDSLSVDKILVSLHEVRHRFLLSQAGWRGFSGPVRAP